MLKGQINNCFIENSLDILEKNYSRAEWVDCRDGSGGFQDWEVIPAPDAIWIMNGIVGGEGTPLAVVSQSDERKDVFLSDTYPTKINAKKVLALNQVVPGQVLALWQ